MKIAVKILAIILLATICLTAYGCDKPTDSEVETAYKELYPKAYELAQVIYGKGLDYEGKVDLDRVDAPHYMPVSADAPYKTKAELEEAVLAVYSESYYNDVLKTVLFGGAESDENGMFGVSPRYKESSGQLYVNVKYEQFVMLIPRDYDMVKVKDVKRSEATVSVPYNYNGEAKKVETVMVKTEKGWRFDGIV